MARQFSPKVLTGNDLFEGDVVYLGPDGTWVRRLGAAKIYRDEASAETALTLALAQQAVVVGPYLADISEPLHFREVARARGPSNHPEHGKQAELADV